jgi:dihydrofolate synthase/folylpolyglutamate synthase
VSLPPSCEWPRPWTLEEVLGVLRRSLTFGINPSLTTITELTDALGRPQDALSVVQVTGTNGKTSTVRMIEAILRAHGRRTGLYTSPELERFPERIEVDGVVSSDEEFAAAVGAAIGTAIALYGESEPGVPAVATEFELLTAAALWRFRESGVDTAVLEVGMGGRWDATSAAAPAVAVITGVGLDHTAVLGDTLEAIAAEKAAIIVPASAPILGPGTAPVEAVFLGRAQEVGSHARVVREGSESSPVAEELTVRYWVTARPHTPGGTTVVDVDGVHATYSGLQLTAPAYQTANIATAIAAAEAALGRALDAEATRSALARLAIPGRFEVVATDPVTIVDGSHNPQAAAVLAGAVADAWPDPAARPVVVLGVLADKDAAGIIEALAPVAAGFAVVAPESPRARDAGDLADIVRRVAAVEPLFIGALGDGIAAARASSDHGVIVTGSLTTAGAARRLLRDGS